MIAEVDPGKQGANRVGGKGIDDGHTARSHLLAEVGLEASKELGLKEVPVDFQDFDNVKDELSYLVADNRIAELAEIDRAELADIIGDIDSGDFDLELTGFELDMVEDLMTACPPLDLDDDEETKSKSCPNCGEAL